MGSETLKEGIKDALNRNSAENGSDTPDFILAEFLELCLNAFDKAVTAREAYYHPGNEGTKWNGKDAEERARAALEKGE